MSAFLASQREAALRLGAAVDVAALPTARDESWRYTALRAIDARAHVPDAEASTRAVDLAALGAVDGARLVFVNGAYRADLSHLEASDGVTIERDAPIARAAQADAFERLAEAFAPRGITIRIAAGAKVDAPLALVFVAAASMAARTAVAADAASALAATPPATVAHARVRLVLEAHASLTLIEQHVGGATGVLANLTLGIEQARGAALDLVRLQSATAGVTVVARTGVELAEAATLRHWALEAGADLSRHALAVRLVGRGARFRARGALVLDGRQHADVQLSVDHVARDTRCDLAYRGVADGRARAVFFGNIRVQAGADGTDAQLSNKNLLLSPHAEIDAKPVLEIFADEVKASHGATVGQLDETALFYLRSRGLPREAARAVLTQAFARAVLDDVPVPGLRARVEAALAGKLPA